MSLADSKPECFWWEAAPPASLPRQEVAESSDVAVVGAGYTGLSAALTLARAGLSVQVFDRQRPGEGASTRNGGIVSGNLRIGFSKAIARFGFEHAKAMYAEGKEAREDFRRFVEDEGIDCDFQMSGRFTGFLNPTDRERMGKEAGLLNQHLEIGAHLVEPADQDREVGSGLYYGGMVRPDIGVIDPAKFHAGLLEKALGAGAVVHGEQAVLGIARKATHFKVETAGGRVRAGDVIVATNGYTDGVAPWLRRRLVPATSRIVATEPLSPNLMAHILPSGRACGELRRLYRYYRPSPDGTRLLIGTREPAFGSDPERATAHVRRSMIEIFPELRDTRITHSWSGFVAFNLDHLPRLFSHDGIHYACGFCGSGTVWGRWLGAKAAYKILGAPNAVSVFDCPPPSAVPLYGGRPWFLPFAVAWYGLQDRMRIQRKA